jgi:putative transposase
MPHSFNKIWIHAIWATKDRQTLISPKIEKSIFNILHQQFTDAGCLVKTINGMNEHIHCLFLLNPKKSVSEIIKQIKGSSSHYVNQKKLTDYRFAWQTGYAAYSVSESLIPRVEDYIQNQKQHHKKRTFQEEYIQFLNLYGFEN